MVLSVKRSRDPSLASEANGQLQLLLRPRLLIIVHYHEKCFEQVFLRNRLFFVFYFFPLGKTTVENNVMHNCFLFVAKYFIVQKLNGGI